MKYIKTYESMTDKVIMTDVSKKDAKELIKWWDANTNSYHFKKRNDRNKYGKYDVMRQLTDELQLGDYVIIDSTHVAEIFKDVVNNNPGKVIKKNGNIIKVEYDSGQSIVVTTNSVIVFAKTKEEVLLKFNALKYNI